MLLARHEGAWNTLWNRFDVQLDSANEWTETVLHLHIFHLLQTVSPHTLHLDVGVPARGWHGEAYRGHVFWDEMFIFPFFNFERPEPGECAPPVPLRPARRRPRRGPRRRVRGRDVPLAERRHRPGGDPEAPPQPEVGSLAARPLAQPAARQHRHRLQRVAALHGHREHGVPALHRRGAADRDRPVLGQRHHVQRGREDRYEIHGVVGPDEYHEAYPDSDEPGLRNNTYTNVMAVWVLQRALETLDVLPPHYRQELVQELTHPGRRGGPLAGHQPEDEGRLPCRRRPDPVRGLRGSCPSSTGRATGSATATSSGWTGSWRPRVTAPTATSSPSRPTSSCCCSCSPGRSCAGCCTTSATT